MAKTKYDELDRDRKRIWVLNRLIMLDHEHPEPPPVSTETPQEITRQNLWQKIESGDIVLVNRTTLRRMIEVLRSPEKPDSESGCAKTETACHPVNRVRPVIVATFRGPKQWREELQAKADAAGVSLNGFIARQLGLDQGEHRVYAARKSKPDEAGNPEPRVRRGDSDPVALS
jgi:hypothetical protein